MVIHVKNNHATIGMVILISVMLYILENELVKAGEIFGEEER